MRSVDELEDNLHTYFTNTIRHINFNDIDTSVTFGFFIKDENSFKAFIDRFRNSCKKGESFLGIELDVPQENTTDFESVCDEGDVKKAKEEDGFEVM